MELEITRNKKKIEKDLGVSYKTVNTRLEGDYIKVYRIKKTGDRVFEGWVKKEKVVEIGYKIASGIPN